MTTATEEKRESFGVPLLVTLLFHAGLILLLYLVIIHQPIPPFPDAGGSPGIEISLGTDITGSGDNSEASSASVKSPTPPDDNHVVVNDVEPTVAIDHKKAKPKKHVEKAVAEVKTTAPEPSNDLQKALANWESTSKKVSGTGTGHGTGDKPGNEGDPNGTPNGKGTGVPGDGLGGNGPGGPGGPGPGGPGHGTGARLKNRHLVVPATLVSNQQEEGIVCVAITVDKEGNVTEAHAIARGSTTTNSALWSTARQAALKAKFDKSPDGTSEQHGIYQFDFTLK
jgi:outer membrane biosynthesis protein TonB